jgi:hypothetical protein
MSAPEKVRTSDGMVWERRAETRGGLALYAVEGAPKCCPPFVMATLAELAEHGIQSAELAAVVAELGALPMPAGPSVEVSADRLTRTFMPVQSLREDDEFGLHHSYRVSRDLPDAVAESVAEDRSWGGS